MTLSPRLVCWCSEQELRLILNLRGHGADIIPSLSRSEKHIWRSLQKKGLIRTSVGPHHEVLTPAGEDLLALLLGGYTVVPWKVGRA